MDLCILLVYHQQMILLSQWRSEILELRNALILMLVMGFMIKMIQTQIVYQMFVTPAHLMQRMMPMVMVCVNQMKSQVVQMNLHVTIMQMLQMKITHVRM